MAQDQAGQGQGFESTQSTSQASQNAQTANFQSPMKNWKSRITKKPFGIYVNPKNSPVDPERFTGYHAAVDLEIVSDEANLNVPFFAICNGELKIKEKARGYGGLVAQYCEVNGSSVLVLYGHVNLSTIASSVGENLMAGQQIGFLGEVGPDTDYERKHLHLGIHKGPSLVTSGYVSTQKELENFLDPTLIID
jgi:murein DD-endopeptidase MepM/ murein hydrolase activator NlpD